MVVRSILVLFLARLASLNALAQTQHLAFWRAWLRAPVPSADTLGRVFTGIEICDLREVLYALYRRFRRNKVLQPPWHGLVALILDGHESHASYRRHCSGCLQRRRTTAGGEHIQYYHRNVTAALRVRGFTFLIDAEPVLPGEGEVAAARRLLKRLLCAVPRSFDVVVADGLYVQGKFFEQALAAGKHVVAVLKDERRDLLEDARGLFSQIEPRCQSWGCTQRLLWDQEGFTSWSSLKQSVRVVRSLETTLVKRQLDSRVEQLQSEWFWVTTLPVSQASTRAIVELGHERWAIENQGFNELANHWHADHVFRHDPTAILGFWLMALLAYNVFHVFMDRNLKPQRRRRFSTLHWARLITSDLYHCSARFAWALPP